MVLVRQGDLGESKKWREKEACGWHWWYQRDEPSHKNIQLVNRSGFSCVHKSVAGIWLPVLRSRDCIWWTWTWGNNGRPQFWNFCVEFGAKQIWGAILCKYGVFFRIQFLDFRRVARFWGPGESKAPCAPAGGGEHKPLGLICNY